jgi:predicted metal-binding protein
MKVGIIICDRYRSCGGGKCFRAARQREGAFSRYPADEPLEIVGYSTCGGCPGGNVEYVPEEMLKNGAEVIHLATGLVVGYPPCPHLDYFIDFIPERFGVPVEVGTHPVPEKYRRVHRRLPSWSIVQAQPNLLANEEVRKAYD